MSAALDLDTKFHFKDGAMTVQRSQNCAPIAEHAKRLQVEGFHGSADMKHAASIPYIIIEKYCNDHGIEFREFMQNKEHIKRVLNDPSLSHFRIWRGNV